MLNGDSIDPGAFLACQLYRAAVSTKGKIVIGGRITSIVRFLGIESNSEDRVSESEWLDKASFVLMSFCKIETGRMCWIYLRDDLCRLPILSVPSYFIRLTFIGYLVMIILHLLLPLLTLAALVLPLNLPLLTLKRSKPPLGPFRRSKCPFELIFLLRTPLFMTLPKNDTRLHGMLATQTQYFQDSEACLETWRDWHISHGPSPHPPSAPPF